jgi:alpha-ribazole phosphatase
MRKTLFWLARHGSTTDSGKGIFRGQRNSALDKEGFLDAHEQKEFFAKKKWHNIFCSTLTRALQTATIIVDDRKDEEPIPHPGLKPWDVGYLTGKDKKKYGKEMQYFIDNPYEVPEDGESEDQFQKRVHPLLGDAMRIGLEQDEPCIVVSHSSVIHALSHLLYGDRHKDASVNPGGILEIYLEDGEFKSRPALKEGTDDSSFRTHQAS